MTRRWRAMPPNKRRSRDYLTACMCLDDVEIIRNDIEFDALRSAPAPVLRELVAKGYD